MSSSPLTESLSQIYASAAAGKLSYAGNLRRAIRQLCEDKNLTEAQKIDTTDALISLLPGNDQQNEAWSIVLDESYKNPALESYALEKQLSLISASDGKDEFKIVPLIKLQESAPENEGLRIKIENELLKIVDRLSPKEQPLALIRMSEKARDKELKANLRTTTLERLSTLPGEERFKIALLIYKDRVNDPDLRQKAGDIAYATITTLAPEERVNATLELHHNVENNRIFHSHHYS